MYNDTDAIFNAALASLPEIKSAEIAVENSELSVEIAKAGFLPSLSFGAGVGTSYQHNQGSKDVRAILDENNNVVFVPNGFGKQLEDNLGFNVGFSFKYSNF